MGTPFKAFKVMENVYWVGAIDNGVRDFHGYKTDRGTTYNAFLILGEKITLVDTVKAHFKDEMMARIASVIDPERIEIIVSNHAEMDHSGCLPEVIALVKPEKVYASVLGVAALKNHFHQGLDLTPVKDGDRIEISSSAASGGPLTLQFIETRFLHWPDSMFSYLVESKLLFSQDAFGMHLASYERYASEIPDWMLEVEGARYFANILLPYASMILKLLEKVKAIGLEPVMVAPDHGPIWREDFPKILAWYEKWATQAPNRKAVVIYDTMWESTELMARAVAEGLYHGGAQVKIMPLSGSHRSDVITELLDAGALVVGSPTLNNQIFPTLADVLTYVKGLKPLNLVGGTFGSFGWSGESIKQLDGILSEMGVENLGSVKTAYVPKNEVLERCYELGLKVAERVVKNG